MSKFRRALGIASNFKEAMRLDTVRLPDGYRRVEYLHSTGTQYIDTEFIPDCNSRVVCDFSINNKATSMCVFCSRDTDLSNTFTFWASVSSSTARSDYGDDIFGYMSDLTLDEKYTVDKNNNMTTLNGSVLIQDEDIFTSPVNLILFASYTSGNAVSTRGLKIYNCRIYDDGTLVRDFIPAVRESDSEAGLYDLVTDTFYTNAGSGSFIVPD